MDLLRSSIISALLSLLLLMGYAAAGMDLCCADDRAAHMSEGAKTQESAPAKGESCPCLCHQLLFGSAELTIQMIPQELRSGAAGWPTDEFAPDAEPQGIEYPPQLA